MFDELNTILLLKAAGHDDAERGTGIEGGYASVVSQKRCGAVDHGRKP